MKIVMQYNVDGGYECGTYEIVLAFEYDSAEAFLLDFEKAWQEIDEQIRNHEKQIKEWRKSESEPKNATQKDYNKWIANFPATPGSTFYFCGHSFYWNDFREFDRKSKEYKVILPNVYELNEWHTKKMGEQ